MAIRAVAPSCLQRAQTTIAWWVWKLRALPELGSSTRWHRWQVAARPIILFSTGYGCMALLRMTPTEVSTSAGPPTYPSSIRSLRIFTASRAPELVVILRRFPVVLGMARWDPTRSQTTFLRRQGRTFYSVEALRTAHRLTFR